MRRSLMLRALLLVLGLWSGAAVADQLLMARSPQGFPEAMLALQDALREHGYTLARVQRVDIGLTGSGYQTDKYRVVFFGRSEEMRRLSERYPDLVPYLPLKIAIFAEGSDTLLVASSPGQLLSFFDHPELAPVFAAWERDLNAIFDRLRSPD